MYPLSETFKYRIRNTSLLNKPENVTEVRLQNDFKWKSSSLSYLKYSLYIFYMEDSARPSVCVDGILVFIMHLQCPPVVIVCNYSRYKRFILNKLTGSNAMPLCLTWLFKITCSSWLWPLEGTKRMPINNSQAETTAYWVLIIMIRSRITWLSPLTWNTFICF